MPFWIVLFDPFRQEAMWDYADGNTMRRILKGDVFQVLHIVTKEVSWYNERKRKGSKMSIDNSEGEDYI